MRLRVDMQLFGAGVALAALLSVGCSGADDEAAGATSGGRGGSGSSSSISAGSAGGSGGGAASGPDAGDGGFAVGGCDPSSAPTRFISCVLSYEPGENAGFGQSKFPDIVYGPPVGAGTVEGSLDVVTLGGGGEIAFGFGGNGIKDGPGPDFIIFENPWFIGGDPTDIWAEPGVVSVSDDAETWVDFPCRKAAYPYTGCGGWHPVMSNPMNGISPFDASPDGGAGGDAFDLADIGVTHARYIRIRDVSFRGGAPTEGFDLDAAAILNADFP